MENLGITSLGAVHRESRQSKQWNSHTLDKGETLMTVITVTVVTVTESCKPDGLASKYTLGINRSPENQNPRLACYFI